MSMLWLCNIYNCPIKCTFNQTIQTWHAAFKDNSLLCTHKSFNTTKLLNSTYIVWNIELHFYQKFTVY